MKNLLNISKICFLNQKLYFFSEEESVFGNIDLNTGFVEYSDKTPKNILGSKSYNTNICCINDMIYSLIENGKKILEYDTSTNQFKEYNISNSVDFDSYGGLAGFCVYKDCIYAFFRYQSQIFIFNTETKQSCIKKINITENIMWMCNNSNMVYLLSMNCQSVYYLNLDSFFIERNDSDICLNDENKSNMIFPFHCMACDSDNIYFCDARVVLKFNINNKKMAHLFTSLNDIGSRIVVTDNGIIIPPWTKESFCIIDKCTGKVKTITSFPKTIKNIHIEGWSITGVPTQFENNIYFPVISSDVLLCIDKQTWTFNWIDLYFEKFNISYIVGALIDSDTVLYESTAFTLQNYLLGLFNVDYSLNNINNDSGNKIHNIIKNLN